ncbi:hypothetical protein ANN_00497 [Periplaneta americana]|uniref:C2H2-type domain-containing protein n=1 Tax=Periplaneta americana TaxID=6978 RepID=A0ABQ8TTS0_PERAM|nr:hypothetical protein ANN_00497 [Periplaneta americana]
MESKRIRAQYQREYMREYRKRKKEAQNCENVNRSVAMSNNERTKWCRQRKLERQANDSGSSASIVIDSCVVSESVTQVQNTENGKRVKKRVAKSNKERTRLCRQRKLERQILEFISHNSASTFAVPESTNISGLRENVIGDIGLHYGINEIMVDEIKLEPDPDPLAVTKNNDADTETKKSSSMGRNVLVEHKDEIKLEYIDSVCDPLSLVKTEETPDDMPFPSPKCEPVESCNVDTMKDELVLEPLSGGDHTRRSVVWLHSHEDGRTLESDTRLNSVQSSSSTKHVQPYILRSDEIPFRCDINGKNFYSNHKISRYTRGSKDIRAHCFKQTSSEHGIGKYLPENVKQVYLCLICSKDFNELSQLNEHILTHSELKPWKCEICGRTFRLSSQLKCHVQLHFGIKPFKCKICGKEFKYADVLNVHIRSHTGENPYTCDVCDKNFRSKESIRIHMLSHTGQKPYLCDICGKGFKQSNHLKEHVAIHNGYKPFICDICGKGLTQSHSLKKHLRLHAEKMHFKCRVCDKNFTRKEDLTIHMRCHTGDIVFDCDICGKEFISYHQLKQHVPIHTAAKDYDCKFCGKSFSRLRYLDNHLRNIHNTEKPFTCDICNKSYKYKKSIITHLRSHSDH